MYYGSDKSNRGRKQRKVSVKQGTNPDFSEDISTPANPGSGKTVKETMLLEMRASRYIFLSKQWYVSRSLGDTFISVIRLLLGQKWYA